MKIWNKLFGKKEIGKATSEVLYNPYRIRYTIPVGNLSKKEAEEQIRLLMSDYGDNWWPTYLRKDRKKKIEKLYGNLE